MIFKKLIKGEKMSRDEKIIKDAQNLYGQGEWSKAIELLDMLLTTRDKEEVAEANRIRGWCYYYLGIKGDKSKKNENLEKAEEHFGLSLAGGKKNETRISALNGLVLSLWVLGKKEEAKLESFKATEKFPQEPSIWNTKAILYRWANDWKVSVKICERVYETAIEKKDFRTAGHSKHNRADALKELGKLDEAKKDYQESLKLYKKYQKKSGESAKFHIDKVEEKISNLRILN